MKKKIIIPLIILVFFGTGLSYCIKETDGGDTNNPSVTPGTTGDYTVFAWNDLGMHCLNPSYDKLVILPPYNNVLVQVVKRGNPPTIVTTGITVAYRLLNNTTSYNKRSYSGFWDNFQKLFGTTPPAYDIGMKGKGLAGEMDVSGDHFTAEGIYADFRT
jgi:hypothetical protein